MTTEGMLGSEQYVVPVFLQYELENITMALSAFSTLASCSGSSGSFALISKLDAPGRTDAALAPAWTRRPETTCTERRHSKIALIVAGAFRVRTLILVFFSRCSSD